MLAQYVDATLQSEPDGSAWYVLGRMAEKYGLDSAAREYYARVNNENGPKAPPSDCYVLATKRIAALSAPRGKK